MSNAHSKGKRTFQATTISEYFDNRVRNYWPADTEYNAIMDGEYATCLQITKLARLFGFNYETLPVIFIKEFFLKEMKDEPIRALYWTARIVKSQKGIAEEKELRGIQKSAGFAALYGGSVKIPRV